MLMTKQKKNPSRGNIIEVAWVGHKCPGGTVGLKNLKSVYAKEKKCPIDQQTWVTIKNASIWTAVCLPFTVGFKYKIACKIRVTPNIIEHIDEYKDSMHISFITELANGHLHKNVEKKLLSLLVKSGKWDQLSFSI